MRVNDDAHLIPVSYELPGRTMVMNLSLILDPIAGPVMVDASMPGTESLVAAALKSEGFEVESLQQIIVTHQDLDHIGALKAIKTTSGARVLAHRIEAPYIEGKTRLAKYPSEEVLEKNPSYREMLNKIQFTEVDQLLEDGEVLDIAGGVRVFFTPGHAPGHICLFLERSKTLITGDALTSENGQLKGPNEGATPDMPSAIQSVKNLASLEEVQSIICYHGGLVNDDAHGQLKRLAQQL